MKKLSALMSMILAICLCVVPVLSGMAESTDASTVLATVNGEEITYAVTDSWYQQLLAAYQSYGYDISDTGIQDALKGYALQTAVQECLINQKAHEWGLDEITEEEKAEIEAAASAEWSEIIEEYEAYYYGISDASTDEEKATARLQILAMLEAEGYTESSYIKSVLDNEITARVEAKLSENITVTDEDIEAAYQAMVEEDRAQYEGNAASYEFSTMYFGQTSTWVPEGYRGITQILLIPDETLLTTWQDLSARLEEQQAEAEGEEATGEEDEEEADYELDLTAGDSEELFSVMGDDGSEILEDGIFFAEEDAEEEEDEEEVKEVTEADAEPVTQEQVDAAAQAIMDSLQPVIDEITEKFNSGVSFNELIDAYNQDPGMNDEATRAEGYSVSKDSIMWDPSFVEAAFSIDEIGGISKPVLGSYGVYIAYYLRDVPSGAVELTEEMKNELYEEQLSELESEAFQNALNEWAESAVIEYTEAADAFRTVETEEEAAE